MDRVTPVEARYIANAVNTHSGVDLSGYAMASLRLVLGQFARSRATRYTDLLINRLLDDPEQLEDLVYNLELPDLEMFRDPEFWHLMKNKLLPGLAREHEKVKVWIPHNSSGEELFSLLVLLHELELSDHFDLIAGNFSYRRQQEVSKGILGNKKFQISQMNYEAAGGTKDFRTYFTESENRFILNVPGLEKVNFTLHPVIPEPIEIKSHLVLLRNRLLMFTDPVREQILQNVAGCMENRALLILGFRERLPENCSLFFPSDEFSSEQIFKTKG